MKRRRRELDIFSLSFLDIIACGFGAVVLIVLISSYVEAPRRAADTGIAPLLGAVVERRAELDGLGDELSAARATADSARTLLQRLEQALSRVRADRAAAAAAAEALTADIARLERVRESLDRSRRISVPDAAADRRDEEVGGIPVDSDHVVFIVDTSGSMQEIWPRVVREIENVIRIHPRVRGFQILNDNGVHILPSYAGRWIPDTPGRRESVIRLLRSWRSASNSSPAEGLEIALRRYARPGTRLSIYIFGDEYSGGSYDPVIRTLSDLNTNRVSGGRLARVHAVGFLSRHSTGRFATLMREITRLHDGTFVALPR